MPTQYFMHLHDTPSWQVFVVMGRRCSMKQKGIITLTVPRLMHGLVQGLMQGLVQGLPHMMIEVSVEKGNYQSATNPCSFFEGPCAFDE
jgi:hypothetical protein